VRRRFFMSMIFAVLLGIFPSTAQKVGEMEILLDSQVLIQDIRTATYIELALWIQSLGLVPQGGKPELQKMLANYFEVVLPQESGAPSIEILQARRLSRWAQSEDTPRSLSLIGDVVVIFIDRESESTHRIRAQRVFLDEDENILVAEGNLRYELRSGERIEIFSGDQLYFDVEDWNGMFLGGQSNQLAKEDDEPPFRYTGGVIRRTADDLVLLKEGIITSSVWEPPAYSIHAEEIIVYGAGEWSIQAGVLYLGNIPLAGIPAFFYPGEELFFHPSVGTDTKRGQYVNTTSYFLGRAAPEDSLFDFLRFTNDEQAYEQEIRGLFLRNTDIKINDIPEDFWTLQLDYYSRLGFHLGSEWSLSDRGALRSFSGYIGVAFTRNLYSLGGEYTPYYFDTNSGSYESDWNNPYTLGYQIPFRFGIELEGELGSNSLSWRWSLPFFSDPFYPSDLFNRNQNLDWSTLLGISSNPVSTFNEGSRPNLLWESNLQARVQLPKTRGLLSSIQINRFSQEMNWRSKTIDPTVLSSSVSTALNSPESSTFILSTLTPLRLDFTLQGTFYPLQKRSFGTDQPNGDVETPNAKENETKQVATPRPPWETEFGGANSPIHGAPEIIEEAENSLVIGDLLSVENPNGPGFPGSFTLGYEGSNSFELTGVAQNPTTYVPSPGASNFDYWQRGEILRFNLRTNALFPGQLLRFQANSTIQWTDRAPFDTGLPEADTLSLENRIRGANSFSLGQTNTLTLSPFRSPSPFETSRIAYTLSPIWYSRTFTQFTSGGEVIYKENPLNWDKDSISAHSLGATIGWKRNEFTLSSSITAILPPLVEEYQIQSSLGVSPIVLFTLNSGIVRSGEDFITKPLILGVNLTPLPSLALHQTLTYNFNAVEPTSYTATLDAWLFSARFVAEQQKRQEFQTIPSTRWVTVGENEFLPSNISLTFEDTVDFRPAWKNRILSKLEYNLTFQQGLQRISDSVLTLDFAYSLSVFEFMDFSLRSRSSNRQMYLYFDGLREQLQSSSFNPPVGRNFFIDLAKSFNFFSIEDRQDSNFNLDSLSLAFTHYLGDWNIDSEYSVKPVLNTTQNQFVWDSRFTLLVQWKPISQISREVRVDRDGIITFGDE